MRGMLRAIEVDLVPDLSAVQRVVVREVGDDYTSMTFTELRRDADLPPSWFDVRDPSEVDVASIAGLPRLPDPAGTEPAPTRDPGRDGRSK